MEDNLESYKSTWLGVRYWMAQIVENFHGHPPPKIDRILNNCRYNLRIENLGKQYGGMAQAISQVDQVKCGWLLYEVRGST